MDISFEPHGNTNVVERELKFALAPQDCIKLKSHPLLAAGRRSEATITSIYFDTNEHDLKNAGLSLRLRISGDRVIQTLKQQSSSPGALFVRDEYEIVRDAPGLDLDHVRCHCPASLYKKLDDSLHPIITVEAFRTTWVVPWKGSAISVTLDEGTIKGGANVRPIHELEIELSHGDVEAAFIVALQIAGLISLRLEVASKSDRGYLLADNRKACAEKSDLPKLDRSMTVAAAFRLIASHCIYDFGVNEAAFLDARVPEALHQMRVATRRLLSLLTFSDKILSIEERAMLRARTKEAFKTLGRARDLDIILAALEERGGPITPGVVLDDVRRQRDASYDEAVTMLTSRRFCLYMLGLLAFVECGPWARAWRAAGHPRDHKNVYERAARILDRLWKKIGKFDRASRLDADKRHRLRINAKTFRYACDFFGHLFEGSKQSHDQNHILDSLRTFQDVLGALNDDVIINAFFDRTAGSCQAPHQSAFAAMDSEPKRALLDRADKAQKRLFKQDPFWR